MPAGRPTDYSQEILDRAQQYLLILPEDEVIHSIAGLSIYIGIARSTIYEWAKQEDKRDFSDILEEILSKQERALLTGSLKGALNATISKLMLTKHGYSDKQETDVTSKGEKLTVQLINYGDSNDTVQS